LLALPDEYAELIPEFGGSIDQKFWATDRYGAVWKKSRRVCYWGCVLALALVFYCVLGHKSVYEGLELLRIFSCKRWDRALASPGFGVILSVIG
jgi:hypothetical protein